MHLFVVSLFVAVTVELWFGVLVGKTKQRGFRKTCVSKEIGWKNPCVRLGLSPNVIDDSVARHERKPRDGYLSDMVFLFTNLHPRSPFEKNENTTIVFFSIDGERLGEAL